MKEAGDEAFHVVFLVVNVGVKEAGGGVLGEDVIIGDGGGDQCAMTFFYQHLVACSPNVDFAIALDAGGDDEAVVLAQVSVEGLGDFHHPNVKVGSVDDLNGFV